MGNLSCVSCKSKEKEASGRSLTPKSCADNKTSSENDVLATTDAPSSHNTTERQRFEKHTAPHVPTSPVELYEILRSQRLKDGQITADEQGLDDVQKAAKAIVDMTVYLTTQVIFPAYLRYLKEDHPGMYSQYCQKAAAPLPFGHAISVGGEVR